jgi:hypothetical protein
MAHCQKESLKITVHQFEFRDVKGHLQTHGQFITGILPLSTTLPLLDCISCAAYEDFLDGMHDFRPCITTEVRTVLRMLASNGRRPSCCAISLQIPKIYAILCLNYISNIVSQIYSILSHHIPAMPQIYAILCPHMVDPASQISNMPTVDIEDVLLSILQSLTRHKLLVKPKSLVSQPGVQLPQPANCQYCHLWQEHHKEQTVNRL